MRKLDRLTNNTKMEARLQVLNASLVIETATSGFLAGILRVKDPQNSYSFSNKSTALSFNQKILLAIDIGVLKKEDRDVCLKFMEIRNQFMHNLNAGDFTSCVGFIKGLEEYLYKKYKPDAKLEREEKIKACYTQLSDDVEKLLDIMFKTFSRNAAERAENQINKHRLEAFKKATKIANEQLQNFENGGKLNPKVLRENLDLVMIEYSAATNFADEDIP